MKSIKILNPDRITEHIHLIGCGSIGSYIAMGLAKMGVVNVTLYDNDIVEHKNIGNQMFGENHIGIKKVVALQEIIFENTEIKYEIKDQRLKNKEFKLPGIIISAVDSITTRKTIAERNRHNPDCVQFFDIRSGIYECDVYSCNLNNPVEFKSYIDTTWVPKKDTPSELSVCGITQSGIFTSYILSGLLLLRLTRYINHRDGIDLEYGYNNTLKIAYQNNVDALNSRWV